MKKLKIFAAAFAGIAIVLLGVKLGGAHLTLDSAEGWFKAGSKPDSYRMGISSEEHQAGSKCAYIKSIESEISGFGTYMQMSKPGEYLGKSVRLTGWIKSKDVKDWAGMWMRVDGEDDRSLSFDNMEDRAIKGTTGWTKYAITLDVPKSAKAIAFGVLLSSTGQVYFDDMSFTVLGPATGSSTEQKEEFPLGPTNLNFEE